MNYKNVYKSLLVVLFITFLPVAENISAELAAPQMVIKNASEELKSRMQDENFVKDFGKINEYVDEVIFPVIDFNKISQRVIGPTWKQATDEQKVKFKKEFKKLLVRVYARAFYEFDDWSIRYLPLRGKLDNVKKVTVRTQVLQPGVKPIEVDYVMSLSSDQWKVFDIKIIGASIFLNYQKTFIKKLKGTGSLDSVIAMLEKKNNQVAQN